MKRACVFLIMGLRPMLGPANCCFEIGCTQYAILQLETEPLLIACTRIVLRLLTCNPLTAFFRNSICSKKKCY